MINSIPSAGTAADSSTTAQVTTSAQLAQNPMLSAVLSWFDFKKKKTIKMTLSDFIQIAKAYPKANTPNYCVEIPLKNGIISKLTVIDCNNDYEALERAYLYLNEIIKTKNNGTRKN